MLADPWRYAATGFIIFVLLSAWALYQQRKLDVAAVGWVVYLLLLSTWEEWVFRLAIPYFMGHELVDLRVAAIGSNIVFGAVHYFTLRWKWQWCLGAFIGGLAFSRQLSVHFDLALVIGIHWVATFLNTPRPPGSSRTRT